MTTEYKPRKWTWWEYAVVALVLLGFGVALAGMLGCVALEKPLPDGTTETVYVPGISADSAEVATGGLLGFLTGNWEAVAAAGLALLFPRTRQNLVGAGKALAKGDVKDAALHVGALTPFVHTPEDKPTSA